MMNSSIDYEYFYFTPTKPLQQYAKSIDTSTTNTSMDSKLDFDQDSQMTQSLYTFAKQPSTTTSISVAPSSFKRTLFDIEDEEVTRECKNISGARSNHRTDNDDDMLSSTSSSSSPSKIVTLELIKTISKQAHTNQSKRNNKKRIATLPSLSTAVSINLLDSVKSLHSISDSQSPKASLLSTNASRIIAQIKLKKSNSLRVPLHPSRNNQVNEILNSKPSLKDRCKAYLPAAQRHSQETPCQSTATTATINESLKPLADVIKNSLREKQHSLDISQSTTNEIQFSLKVYARIVHEQFESRNVSNIFRLNLIQSIAKSLSVSLQTSQQALNALVLNYPSWLTEVSSSLFDSIIRINYAFEFSNII